jgi:hypothetical protein
LKIISYILIGEFSPISKIPIKKYVNIRCNLCLLLRYEYPKLRIIARVAITTTNGFVIAWSIPSNKLSRREYDIYPE